MAEIPSLGGESTGRYSPRAAGARSGLRRAARWSRHLLEMIVSMMIGMFVGAFIFLTAAGGLTPIEGMKQYPVAFVLTMALAMTAPMVGWMRLRGHSARMCYEMTLAMALPAVPICALYWLGVISAPLCGSYCMFSTLAMIGLMVYRRSDYAM